MIKREGVEKQSREIGTPDWFAKTQEMYFRGKSVTVKENILSLEKIFGRSQQIKEVIKQVLQVAESNFSVILSGETGVGKSLVARTIHALSKRKGKPFVKADLGAIPQTLFESELFGYKKGAFTGADKDKKGFIEAANRGTLFLDELENLTPLAQSKLLGVVEERVVIPLGSTTPIPIDIRIISATNDDIKNEIMEKRFREDFFYRLCEFDIYVPPLRERKDDIVFLAERFFDEAVSELGRNIGKISNNAMDALAQHYWVGNVRELKNVIRKSVLLCEGDKLDLDDISIFIDFENPMHPENNSSFPSTLRIAELEKWAITQALIKSKGKQMKAADIVGIDYQKFKRRLKKYGI